MDLHHIRKTSWDRLICIMIFLLVRWHQGKRNYVLILDSIKKRVLTLYIIRRCAILVYVQFCYMEHVICELWGQFVSNLKFYHDSVSGTGQAPRPDQDEMLCWNSLRWRHNEHNGVSNHQPHDFLLNLFFKAQIKENFKVPRHWPLSEGNSSVTGEFHAQRASSADNISIWWRYHVFPYICSTLRV